MKRFCFVSLVIVIMLFQLNTAQSQRIQAIHNAADPQLAVIDIYISLGSIVFQKLEDVTFRDATAFVDAFAGITLNIGIAPANSTSVADTIKNFPITLMANTTYAGIVSGVLNPGQFEPNPDGINIDFDAVVTDSAREVSTIPGQVQFYFMNGVTDAPTVDMYIKNGPQLIDNISYLQLSEFVSLSPGSYTFSLTDSSGTHVFREFNADLSAYADSALAVFFSGFMDPAQNQNGEPAGLFGALPSGTVIEFPKTVSAFQKPILADWNLIGLPLEVSDPFYLSVFPNAIPGTLFGFDGSYFQEDTMLTCTGYWLRFPSVDTVQITGTPFDSCTIDMREGWNIVTGPSCNIASSNILDPSGIIIPGTLFGFDGAYFLTDTLRQGNAYWIRSNAAGQISMNCSTPVNLARTVKSSVEEFSLNQFPAIEISDASGASQKLYFDVELDTRFDKESFSLPPLPPAGAFDARFAENYRISQTDEATILLQYSNPPITITASGLPRRSDYKYLIEEMVSDKEIARYELLEGEHINLRNPEVKKLRISKKDVVPTKFTVSQNYPNPFNPVTEIQYTVPVNGEVEIVVFNMIGQHVRTLTSGYKESGAYSIKWDATNERGRPVSSGIYLYRVKTARNSITKKMLLLR